MPKGRPIKNIPPAGQCAPLCKCGCGNPVIWNRRKNRWNVYVDGHYRKDAAYKYSGWLNHQYIDLHRPVTEIAADFGVNHTTIVKFLNKFGIPRRSYSEALLVNGKSRGANNPAWKGGIAKWSYAPGWKRIARKIRKRDNYTCQICKSQFPKSSKLLHVHHIDGNKFNNDESNLVTVCATCHPKGKRPR